MIGFVILGLILVPLFALMVASVFEAPRALKVAGTFTFVVVLLVAALLAGFAGLSTVLTFVVPQ